MPLRGEALVIRALARRGAEVGSRFGGRFFRCLINFLRSNFFIFRQNIFGCLNNNLNACVQRRSKLA